MTLQIDGYMLDLEDLPEECPLCHRAIAAIRCACDRVFADEYENVEAVESIIQCPACKHLFVATYERQNNGGFAVSSTEPRRPILRAFGAVDDVSPLFLQIYNQAASAEAHGLNEIAGLGYRKALEFLIKDFCILEHPDDAATIKKSFLKGVIKTYFSGTAIGNAAERAAWLGNDEAHYTRIWEQHDVTHLKKLLSMVVNGLNERLEYESLMASFETNQKNDDSPF